MENIYPGIRPWSPSPAVSHTRTDSRRPTTDSQLNLRGLPNTAMGLWHLKLSSSHTTYNCLAPRSLSLIAYHHSIWILKAKHRQIKQSINAGNSVEGPHQSQYEYTSLLTRDLLYFYSVTITFKTISVRKSILWLTLLMLRQIGPYQLLSRDHVSVTLYSV